MHAWGLLVKKLQKFTFLQLTGCMSSEAAQGWCQSQPVVAVPLWRSAKLLTFSAVGDRFESCKVKFFCECE